MKQTASARILQMREDFLLLVAAFNQGREYREAADAQAMAIALTAFEDDHDLDNVEWPPVGDSEDGGLKWVKDHG